MRPLILLLVVAYTCLHNVAARPDYQFSCIHYCNYEKSDERASFCCRMAKVTKEKPEPPLPKLTESVCPPPPKECPGVSASSAPLACLSDDKCGSGEKCCYDKCLEIYVCRKGVAKRNRRAASNGTSNSEGLSTGVISPSLAYAIVDGSNLAVTLINASDKSLALINLNGKVVDVVAGDYLLEVESALAKVKLTEDGLLVTDETGVVLMDKNGIPLSVQPVTSVQRSKRTSYCIVNGDGKKVTLVDSNGERVQAYGLDGRRVTLSQGSYEIEVDARGIVSIERTSEGVFIVTQQGSALTDEKGDLLEALSSETRERVALSQYVLTNGRGISINLITRDGSPTKILDADGNTLPVKTADKNLIVKYSRVTAELSGNVMILKTNSGETVIDERKMALTLKPATKSRRRRETPILYSITDSDGETITLVDQSDVPCSIVFEDGATFSVTPGEKVLKVNYTTLVVFQSDSGLRIKTEDGEVILDVKGNALSVLSPSQLSSDTIVREVRDVSGNVVSLVGPNNRPVQATSEGEVTEVREGVVKILINTNVVRIIEMADGTEVLEDLSGNPIVDINGKRLQVTTVRNKASKVTTYVLVDGDDNEVTLTTEDGTPLTVLDEDDNKVVVLEGDGTLAIASSETARRRRAANEVSLVDSNGDAIKDNNGNNLVLQEVGTRRQETPRNFKLIDGEGTSINLVNVEDGPVKIIDENGERVLVTKGEKTLHIEADLLKVVPGKSGSSVKTLADVNGNAVFSDSGQIKLVPINQDDTQQTDSLLAVAEAFVELNFSLKQLTAVVQEKKAGAEGSSTKTITSVFNEVELFARLAGQLQKKCANKIKGIMQGQDSASDALSVLQEIDLGH